MTRIDISPITPDDHLPVLFEDGGFRVKAEPTTGGITYLRMTGDYGDTHERCGAVMFPRDLRALAIALLHEADKADRRDRAFHRSKG